MHADLKMHSSLAPAGLIVAALLIFGCSRAAKHKKQPMLPTLVLLALAITGALLYLAPLVCRVHAIMLRHVLIAVTHVLRHLSRVLCRPHRFAPRPCSSLAHGWRVSVIAFLLVNQST